jgi:hypothetical protein
VSVRDATPTDDRRSIGKTCKEQAHMTTTEDHTMEENIPNLNVDELSAYAATKHIAGMADEEIKDNIIRMLKADGWKDAAISPMLSEIIRRTKGVTEARKSPRSPPKASQEPTAAMLAQLVELMTPITARLSTLEQRHTTLSSQAHTPDGLSSTLTPPPATIKHRPKLPHPELFDGDRSKYSAFRYKAKAKLHNEYEHLSDEARIAYVVSRCTERASDVVLPWAEQNQHCCSTNDLWAFLDQQYDDPHLKSKALDQLSNLRQGKRSVRDYHMEFNRLELQSGERFGDASRKNMFLKGLNTKLQETLATVDDTLSFEQFVNKATRTSDNLYRVNLNNKSRDQGMHRQKAPNRIRTPSPPENMDWEPTKVSKAHARDEKPKGTQMTCYYCAEQGHGIRDCPVKKKAAKLKVGRAAPQQSSSRNKSEPPSGDESDDSGKAQL